MTEDHLSMNTGVVVCAHDSEEADNTVSVVSRFDSEKESSVVMEITSCIFVHNNVKSAVASLYVAILL